MESVSFSNWSFAFWAVFALLALTGSDSISMYDLDESEYWQEYLENFIYLATSVWWIISDCELDKELKVPIWFLWFLTLIKAVERAYVLANSSSSLGMVRGTKFTADFMKHEHEFHQEQQHQQQQQQQQHDTMGDYRYNYLVGGPSTMTDYTNHRQPLLIQDSVVTVQNIWECKGKLLEGDQGGRLKGLFLSYAFYKILLCRFAGYPLQEYRSQREKNWDLFQNRLLLKEGDRDHDHEKAFSVIENELSFLYDFFYTKYPVVTKPIYLITIRLLEIMTVVVACWASASYLRSKKPVLQVDAPGALYISYIVVTATAIFAIMFVEILQLILIIMSNWMKVKCICSYVRNSSWQNGTLREKMTKLLCRKVWKPSERQLGQYSLFESFDSCVFLSVITYPASFFMEVPRKGQKQGKSIDVSEEVKKAIISCLKLYYDPKSQLTNGTKSLERNGLKERLNWDDHPETRTHMILVWHIATSLCESKFKKPEERGVHFVVASRLSRYCAYLVAFVPELLPDRPCYETQCIFDKVVSAACGKKRKGSNSLYEELRKTETLGDSKGGDGQGENILKSGARLGNDLIDMKNHDLVWKGLAEFWAELILFLAPSDDATCHAERLARGGEFITVLWALLFHAGIDRDPPSDAGTPNEDSFKGDV